MSDNGFHNDNTPKLLSVSGAIMGAILAVMTATSITWTDAPIAKPVQVIYASSQAASEPAAGWAEGGQFGAA